MKKPILVVMAAGLGSRYGGLKQMEAITEAGEVILDFSVYDGWKAGFEKVIFVIKPEMEKTFQERILKPISNYISADYVFQNLSDIPEGYKIPAGRIKPWGTCHAVMACEKKITGPFAVINADDYYGPEAFRLVYDFLTRNQERGAYCMAGYRIGNTLSKYGGVTRGICKLDNRYNLEEIKETKNIQRGVQHIFYEDPETGGVKYISEQAVVSMNFWGFQYDFLERMKQYFPIFLDNILNQESLTSEYLLPEEVSRLLQRQEISVKVLDVSDLWHGITYRKDASVLRIVFEAMKKEGKYPQKLWDNPI